MPLPKMHNANGNGFQPENWKEVDDGYHDIIKQLKGTKKMLMYATSVNTKIAN